jgi:MFS family permease
LSRRSWIGAFGALGEPRFRLLWFGQTVSGFGDRLVPVALVFGVLEVTGSATDVGLVLGAGLVPRVVFVLAGGVWADRLPRQLVMLGADVIRGGAQAVLAVVLLSGTARLWQLLLLSAVYGAANAFFRPASTAVVPHTVSVDRLQQANALMGLSRSGVGIVGPAIAGVLVATIGAGWVFVVDSATFAVSALTLALLGLSAPRARGAREPFLKELRDGWREVAARQWLWVSILYFSISNVALGPLFVLGPVVAKASLGGASAWGSPTPNRRSRCASRLARSSNSR